MPAQAMSERSTPFNGLEELIDRLSRQLETATRTWESEIDQRSDLDLSMGGSKTRLDLADRGDAFVVTVDVPGYERDDLDVRIRGDTLAIRGERGRTVEERDVADEVDADERERTYIRRERETTSFSRQVQLPDPVAADEVTATVNNGVLTVQLPKREPSGRSRTIDIE